MLYRELSKAPGFGTAFFMNQTLEQATASEFARTTWLGFYPGKPKSILVEQPRRVSGHCLSIIVNPPGHLESREYAR